MSGISKPRTHSRISHWTLTLTLFIPLMTGSLPIPAEAGTFKMTQIVTHEWPLSNTHMRVIITGKAKYEGPVDSNDELWAIETLVIVNGQTYGALHGKNGSGIPDTGYLVECGLSCGPDVAVPYCRAPNTPSSYRGRGFVSIYHQFNPEISWMQSSERYTICVPPNLNGGDAFDDDTDANDSCPLLIDLDRNGFHLAGLDDSVLFDIDADGALEEITWTSGGARDGFLVLDANRNGVIDDGTELFGNSSWMTDGSRAPHGYMALSVYDGLRAGGNGDGVIDARDFVFSHLRIWLDADHDGISDAGELTTLAEAGVTRLDLSYRENRRTDPHGNHLRYNSRAWVEGPGAEEIPVNTTDVFFVLGQ